MDERVYNPKFYSDEELKGKSGIYQIRNLLNNNFYIGSAINLKRRKYEHLYDLNTNRHHNIELQRGFNKYGKNNFSFEILEFCKSEERYKIEQYWLDIFYGKEFCYNENPIANKPPVLNKKSVYCIELDKEFESIEQASVELNLYPSNISVALNNIGRTSGTYHWVYIENKNNFSYKDLEIIKKKKSGRISPIICLDDGSIFYNYKDICDAYNIKYPESIQRCCVGKSKFANGYHFMYLSDYKNATPEEIKERKSYTDNKRKIYCSTTGECFESINDACRSYGVHSSGIVNCCRGKISNTKGYIFKYIT